MTPDQLRAENEDLRWRLEEAEETLRAIRTGAVDAVVVGDAGGRRVYTLDGADRAYRVWIEQMSQGAATLDAGGAVAYCNRRFGELLGVPPEQVLGRAFRAFVAEADRARFDAVLPAGRGEFRLTRVDDRAVPVFLSLNRLPPETGAAVGVLVTDLTEQKTHAELAAALTALKDTEDRYRTHVEQVKDYAIFQMDRDGIATTWNEGVRRVLGFEEAEFVGHDIVATIFTPEDVVRGAAQKELADAAAFGTASNDRWMSKKGGQRFWAMGVTTSLKDAAGHHVGFTKVMRDQTDWKLALERLRDGEERYRLVLDAAELGTWSIDPAAETLTTDRRFRDIFGTTADAMSYADAVASLHPDDRDRVRAAIAAATRPDAPAPYEIEYRIVLPGGAVRWVYAKGRAFFGRAGDGRTLRSFDGTVADVTDRKQTEAVREQLLWEVETERRRLADVFRHAPSFMAVLKGADHVFERANEQYVQLVGRRDIVGKPLRDALPEVVGQGYVELLDRVYQSGQTYVGTDSRVLLQREAGRPPEERFVDFVYQPLRDAAGGVTGIYAQGIDLTDRKRAEDRLRASEERFRTLFDSMDEGFCVIELMFDAAGRPVDYRFLEANPAFEKHTGLTAPAGRTARELVPDLDAFWFETYGRVARTGEAIRFESGAAALGGRWFDVYAFRLGDPAGRKVAVLFNDVTARKRGEEALRASEEQFRTLADNMSQFAWMTDQDGWIYWYNQRWFDYTGTTLEQMQGWGWQAVHHPDHLDRVVAKIAECFRTGEVWEDTFPLRGADGQYRWFLSRARPIRDPAGTIVRWFGTNTDVTELRDLQDALKDADRRKDEFLATLAHELRNPLAPVRTGLHVLAIAPPGGEAAAKARDMMDRQVGHMVRLVDDLLDVSRITRGKVELRPQRVDLRTILASAVETSRPLIEAARHELTLDVADGPLPLDADVTRLTQVFGNLLNNAAKYTSEGGHIAVHARAAGGQVEVAIRDNGVGIPADMLPQVFEMFAQVGRSLDRAQGGLGIGLTLVRRLLELHGGTVVATSDGPGRGSTFTVRLPLAQGPVAAGPVAPAGPDVPPRGRKVLVVDDNVDGAESLAMVLGYAGHDTRTAHNGPAALKVAKEFRPDAIFLDIGLPGLSGYEVAQRLRADADFAGTRLIALTGWGAEEDRRRTKDAGFDHHLTKPVDAAAVLHLLAQVPG